MVDFCFNVKCGYFEFFVDIDFFDLCIFFNDSSFWIFFVYYGLVKN